MLAKGCFAVCFTHPPDAGRPRPDAMLERMRSFCGTDETVHALASPDGQCLVGSIAGKGQDRWRSLRADHGRGTVGAFDGWTYTASLLAEHPELLAEPGFDLREQGNGMFTTVAWEGEPGTGSGDGAYQRAEGEYRQSRSNATLRFATDPFGSTPLYYGERDGLFICAASLQLVASLLGLRERDDDARAELICSSEILTDATPVRGIRRAEPGTLYAWDAVGGRLSAGRYWLPAFDADREGQSRDTVDEAAEGFARAVRRTAAAALAHSSGSGIIHAALTGGLDSRTLWAVLLHDRMPAEAVVHAAAGEDGSGTGYDIAVARSIAKRYRIQLREVLLGDEFLRGAEEDLLRFLRASNGLCSGDLLHLPYLYRRHAGYTHALVDSVNCYSERRHGLRRAATGAVSREALAVAVWRTYFKPTLSALLPAHARNAVIETARARIDGLAPDPRDFPSPVAAAEHLYLTRFIGRHGHDAAALQNHSVRFMTPYFDLDYVDALLRVSEPLRAAERVQDAILGRFAPALRNFPRAYADVRTLPVAWRPLQLLPVVVQRLVIDRLPYGIRPLLDLRRSGSNYAEWFGKPLAPLFDHARRDSAPFDAGAVDAFLRGLAEGKHGDTHAAGFLLGQFSDRMFL